MADVIKLLPDALANQIAAGEVIQRPASVVKELMENSVDAGANEIQLIIRDSGKAQIQVVDDGKGMTETDARMSLERHATSKISSTEDLFHIRTMGFRGEALASIAAVAQLEMKTRSASRSVGTHLMAEGSKVQFQDACAFEVGTSISVKNLFYNTPARRKFLKSDAVEMRHIIDEFERVALVNPQINFKLYHNDQELFLLPQTSLRQRIIGIMGKQFNDKLVPIEEATDLVKITGFIGKPENARKTRGEQFLFVNNRFFKSTYFHHAILNAFEGLIPNGHHPAYFIYFELAPEAIDVNIHPTKTEIKFEEEKSIYAILRSTVKRSIGQYHVAPSIDFEREVSFDIPPPTRGFQPPPPGITVNPNFNPFDKEKHQQKSDWERGNAFQHRIANKSTSMGWERLYEGMEQAPAQKGPQIPNTFDSDQEQLLELSGDDDNTIVRQIGLKYILVQSHEGIFLINQYRAHVRILFEGFEEAMMLSKPASQQRLFPSQLTLSAQDTILLQGLLEPLKAIGFEVESLGQQSFVVQAVPAACTDMNIEDVLGGFIDDFRDDRPSDNEALRLNVNKSMAQRSAIKSGKQLEAQEMLSIFRSLMRCKQPQLDLNGRPTFVLLNSGLLDKLFD